MAEVAVQLLLERLSSLIVEEGKLLGGVGRDVEDIKDDLESMRSFLRDADSRGETGEEGVKTWVKQVRDVAYVTEDVLDEFLLRLVRPRNQGFFDSLLHKLHYIKHLKTRHRLAAELLNIKARLKAISKRRKAFSLTNNIGEGMITRANTTPNTWYDPRIASLYIDEAEVVGIEESKRILIRWLTEGELKLTIISVVGMGGLGKTTLVKKVYDNPMVKKHFDYHVWITVSKSPMIGELLRTTIKGVLKATKEQAPEGMDAMDNDELIEMLNHQLWEKRYLIIFDDIWDINVWNTMQFAFPNHDCGSRIIFTTRIGEVAACSNYVHNLEPLKKQEAWKLFCRKVFGSNHDNSSGCPEELMELSRNILKKCSGLPLAIVLISGLLAKKAKTVLEWKNIYDSLGAEMRNDYDLESLSRILLLSYNNLPYYLKPCFLYLSMFPEDYFIKRMTLIRMWIAEGFVETKQGVTMEVVAEDYMSELINRSMIQIAELTKSGEVKSCRMHDLMRETVQSKCNEECFSSTTSSQGMGVRLHEKARRISIYHNNIGDQKYYTYPMGSRCSYVRSLMMFQLDKSPVSFGVKFFSAFRLLRVLDLKRSSLAIFPPELVELIHLRYLSLRSTKITMIPKSVGKLKNLETLDLKQTNVSELPVEILKLQHLRHLLVYRYHFDYDYVTTHTFGVSVPSCRIGNLVSLQKLAFLDVQHQDAADSDAFFKELGKLTQLRKLGITNLKRRDGRDLCLALQKMEHLSSLSLVTGRSTTTAYVNQSLQLESLMPPPQHLRHLYLRGRLMRLPVWIASLRNLTILGLYDSRLSCEEEHNPLKAFQHMPNLVCLQLVQAYNGEELCCSDVGGYKNLKRLWVAKMEGLKRMRFMKGSMPMLRELGIEICPELEMMPQGIEHLSGLQKLWLHQMPPRLVNRIRKRRPSSTQGEVQGEGEGEGEGEVGGEDCWKVQHIPTIKNNYRNTEGTPVIENL